MAMEGPVPVPAPVTMPAFRPTAGGDLINADGSRYLVATCYRVKGMNLRNELTSL